VGGGVLGRFNGGGSGGLWGAVGGVGGLGGFVFCVFPLLLGFGGGFGLGGG